MKRLIRTFLFSVFVITSLLFPCSSFSQTFIPDTWQSGMKLTISTGPGMQPDSWTTVITANGCYNVYNDGSKDQKTHFSLSKEELDSLVSIFSQRNLHRMKTQPRKGIVYDMRSTSIRLEWGDKTWGAGTTASSQVQEKYEEDLREIFLQIRLMVARKNAGDSGA